MTVTKRKNKYIEDRLLTIEMCLSEARENLNFLETQVEEIREYLERKKEKQLTIPEINIPGITC